MEFYVLDEDQARAQELYETIISMRKEMIQHNVEALEKTLTGNHIDTLISDDLFEKAKREMLDATYELDKLQAKRVDRERLERTIEKLIQEGKISVVKIPKIKAEGF